MPFVRFAFASLPTLAALAALGTTTMMAGCNSKTDGRIEVRGTVSYQGQPVDDGSIIFDPVQSDHRQANGSILGGKFSIPAGYGPSQGKYRVRVEGFRATDMKQAASPLAANEDVVAEESYIPEQHNSKSTLIIELSESNAQALSFGLE